MVSRFFDVKSIAWRHLYNIIGVRRTSEELEKKLLRKFGGFKKLSYLCIRNLKERVVGSVRHTIGVWLRWQLIETLAESMW